MMIRAVASGRGRANRWTCIDVPPLRKSAFPGAPPPLPGKAHRGENDVHSVKVCMAEIVKARSPGIAPSPPPEARAWPPAGSSPDGKTGSNEIRMKSRAIMLGSQDKAIERTGGSYAQADIPSSTLHLTLR